MPVLKSVSFAVTFEGEEASKLYLETENAELENIRQVQGHINELITGKISELKAENKLTEASIEDEPSESESDN